MRRTREEWKQAFRQKGVPIGELVRLLGCRSSECLGFLVVGNTGRENVDSWHLGILPRDVFYGGRVLNRR